MGVNAAGWVLTVGVILGLLGVDLLLASVRPPAVGYREAAAGSTRVHTTQLVSLESASADDLTAWSLHEGSHADEPGP